MVEFADIVRHLEKSVASAAFAEAGEFETARQMAPRGKNAHKTVLLGTDRPEIDMNMVANALKLCQRIGAGLEVLHVLSGGGKKRRPALEARRAERPPQAVPARLQQQGISYQQVTGDAPLEEQIVKHAGGRRDILCVVLGAGDPAAGRGRTSGRAKKSWLFERLKCPVVMYAENAAF
jgi:hypothetical protein